MGNYKFYDPSNKSFFETGNARFLEDIEFEGEDKVRNIVFEEEIIQISSSIAINNDQEQIYDNVPEINQDHQDNVEEPHVEQTQQPQDEMPLRRFTRERKNAIISYFFKNISLIHE